MKVPTGVVNILLEDSSIERIDAATARCRMIIELLIERERNLRLANGIKQQLGKCSVAIEEGRSIMPYIYGWAFCCDEVMQYLPSNEIQQLLLGNSRTNLRISLLQPVGS